jgi:Cytochrome C oxidase, cbb3-type, subunit III
MMVAAFARPRWSVSIAAVGLSLCALAPAWAAPADDPHSQASSAEGDISAAIIELDSASRLMAHDPAPYKRGDQRAFNALVGESGGGHARQVGNPGDATGALNRTYAQNDKPASPAKDSRAAGDPPHPVMSAASSGPGSQSHGGGPTLYTQAQAEKGEQAYAQQCASCHGAQQQGATAPAIAGTAFLKKAQLLDWSVADLRTIVVTTMPRSNPGSLSPQQYADVLAYLLDRDCYPAGQQPFPTTATDAIENAKLEPMNGGGQNGTCPVQQSKQGASGK